MSDFVRIKAKDNTSTVEIPPLKLSNIVLPETAVKLKASKEPITFLKNTGLDHNAEFLKQKSLYRYTISRKLSKNDLNKSTPYLLNGQGVKNQKNNQTIENEMKNKTFTQGKETSVISGNSKEQPSRQRHFRRKTLTSTQSGYLRIPAKEKTISVINESSQESSVVTDGTKSNILGKNKGLTKGNVEEENGVLRRQLQLLKGQNKQLRLKYEEQCKFVQQMTLQLNNLTEQNQKLILENKRLHPVNNQSFILENKMENQLLMRDNCIKELQQNIKYLELQNFTLKKAKIQISKQSSQIYKLESKNKELENRLKILSTIRSKRNPMHGSMMSSCSQISLNLSVEDEELDKLYTVLMTTERTAIQKDDRMVRSSLVSEKDTAPSSPW